VNPTHLNKILDKGKYQKSDPPRNKNGPWGSYDPRRSGTLKYHKKNTDIKRK
jgi:hypothetical protein